MFNICKTFEMLDIHVETFLVLAEFLKFFLAIIRSLSLGTSGSAMIRRESRWPFGASCLHLW